MFVKLFGSILDSSIWSTDLATRVVWITMLAMADEFGVVHASVSGLARRACVSEKECRRAIKILSSPDKDDRSGVANGRRIEALQGAWQLINYQKYRELRTHQQIVDAARQSRQRQRRHAQSRKGVTRHDVTVEAEAEAEVEAEAKDTSKALVALKRDDPAPVANGEKSNGNGKHPKGTAVTAIISDLQTLSTETASRLTKDAFRRVMVEITFAYWAKRLGHDHALLDDKRRRILSARLVENGDNLSELLYAVDGALRDDWVMGRDPKSSKRYDGVETLFQDRAHVEKYSNAVPSYRSGVTHPMAVKYAAEPING